MANYQPRHVAQTAAREPKPAKQPRPTSVLTQGVLVLVGVAAIIGAFLLPTNKGPADKGSATANRTTPLATDSAAASGTTTTIARTAGAHSSSTTAASGRATAPTTAADGPTTTSPGAGATPATTNVLAVSSPAANLATPEGLGPALRQAWVAADPGGTGLSSADVQSTASGSVFYAEQQAIGTYWAIARFTPTAQAQSVPATAAGRALIAQFDDVAAFEKAPGQSWSYVGESSLGACSTGAPAPVLAAWDLCSGPGS